jgi:hypothetical protein
MEPFAKPDDETMRAIFGRARRIRGDEIAPASSREERARRLGPGGSRL